MTLFKQINQMIVHFAKNQHLGVAGVCGMKMAAMSSFYFFLYMSHWGQKKIIEWLQNGCQLPEGIVHFVTQDLVYLAQGLRK